LAESTKRFGIFRQNLDFVMAHDSVARGFEVEMNEFADQSIEEFTAWACGMNVTELGAPVAPSELSAPDSWDWRSKGAVTGVKNQQQCGSCWSFSATGSTEGAHFLKTGQLVSLSEQNLVDCSTKQGNQGCNGGWMDQAFQYIISNHGIDTEASYPYTATGPNACKYSAAHIGATLTGYSDVGRGDENGLVNSIYAAPTSVAIDASHQSFQLYKSGIYYEPACSTTSLDHGVLAVGYGNGFYEVKNSWGAGWGQGGYIQMSRNRNNNCGIATTASHATA